MGAQLEMLKGELSAVDESTTDLFPTDYSTASVAAPAAAATDILASATVPSVSTATATTTTTTTEQMEEEEDRYFLSILDEKRKKELIRGVMESAAVCGILGVLMMIDLLFLNGYIEGVPGQLIGFIE